MLDDFGKGYSSLERRRKLDIDGLKIDQSYVRDCATSKRDRALTSGIIQLAHGLGLTVTAEGVETEAQRTFLTGAGCDGLQGYGVAVPEALASSPPRAAG